MSLLFYSSFTGWDWIAQVHLLLLEARPEHLHSALRV